jgi:hypothetical protein
VWIVDASEGARALLSAGPSPTTTGTGRHRRWITPTDTIEAKLERIAGDPSATFGPPRSDRPAILTKAERAAIVARAANWLRVRQRVCLIDAPGSVDPTYGIHRFLGRAGVVWWLCRGFDNHCYVFFNPVEGERKAKIEFVDSAT